MKYSNGSNIITVIIISRFKTDFRRAVTHSATKEANNKLSRVLFLLLSINKEACKKSEQLAIHRIKYIQFSSPSIYFSRAFHYRLYFFVYGPEKPLLRSRVLVVSSVDIDFSAHRCFIGNIRMMGACFSSAS